METAPTIVVGYVPTPPGRAALRLAIEEAQRRTASLHVVNASRGDAYADQFLAVASQLDELEETLAASGVSHRVVQHVGRAEPVDEILRAVEETGAVLVVIGLRHRSSVGKFLLGSTAQRVLLDANCPVLSVKG